MLPSGYIPCVGVVPTNNSYVDTGIYPSNTLSVDMLISGFGWYNANCYVFGSRNTNSNTSAGQLGYYASSTTTNYFAYASARVSMGSGDQFGGIYRRLHFHSDSNVAEAVSESGLVLTATGATTTFTGTRPMYLFGFNNAGTLIWAQYCLHGFLVYDNGTLAYDGEPCYETSSGKFGVYDRVNNTFAQLSSVRSLYKVSITQSTGGQAYAKTYHKDYVKEIYGANNTEAGYDLVKCVAIADSGYSFLNWTDSNGNIVSTEESFEYSATADETLKANFLKDIKDNTKSIYKAIAMGYASYNITDSPSFRTDIFADVKSGSVVVDSLQRATSTFVLKEVPSALQTNLPIFVFSPKGRCIYQGIIWKIEDDTLTCREPMSVWDEEFMFKPNTNLNGYNYTIHTVMWNIHRYAFFAHSYNATDSTLPINYLSRRKFDDVQEQRNREMQLKEEDNLFVTAPTITGNEIKNMEDFLFDLFQYGVYERSEMATVTETYNGQTYSRHCMNVTPFFYKENDEVVIGDNSEKVRNISVTEEEMEATVLAWFDSAGTTLKGYYGATKDGKVMRYDNLTGSLSNFIGYNNYKLKVVTSDDKEATVLAQNLTNAGLNHKITFDLELGELYNFETFKVGTPVKFYYKDKVFNSMVTGVKFDFDMQVDSIKTINVTLGNVRTNLTSKLNLKKVK